MHERPDDIPVGKSDIDPELRGRLAAFRDKVSNGRLVKQWTSAAELPGLVALSLSKTMKTYPAVGWVRADQVANTELLSELNELRKQNQEFQKLVSQAASDNTEPAIEDLASLNEKITLSGTSWDSYHKQTWSCTLSWAEIFGLIAPYLLEHPHDDSLKSIFSSSLREKTNDHGTSPSINDQQYQTVKVQLMALGLVDIQFTPTTKGGMGLFWSLTPQGHSALMQLRTVRTDTKA